MRYAILIHDPADDVGVAVRDLKAGEEVGAVTLEGCDMGGLKAAEDPYFNLLDKRASQLADQGLFEEAEAVYDPVLKAEPNYPGFNMAKDNWTATFEEIGFGRKGIEEGLTALQETVQASYDESIKA